MTATMADWDDVTDTGPAGPQPTDTITTTVTDNNGLTVLTVSGEVDLATAPALETAIDAAFDKARTGRDAVIIDLTAVTFLASAGMATLVAAHQRAHDTRIAVVADGPATSRQLKMTHLDKVFRLHRTLSAALDDLS